MGDRLVVAEGLMSSDDPAVSLFRNPKGRRLLTVPQFGPKNQAYWGTKISRDSIQSMCSQSTLAVPPLASILRS